MGFLNSNLGLALLIGLGGASMVSKFDTSQEAAPTIIQMKIPYSAWQGVAADSDHIYVTSDRNEKWELEDVISVYSLQGEFQNNKRTAYNHLSEVGNLMSFGDSTVIDGKLFVTAYDYNAVSISHSPSSRILIYSLPQLELVEEHQIDNGVAESITSKDGFYWVAYHDHQELHKFSKDFQFIQSYPLSQAAEAEGGYQGAFWEGDSIYLNLHGSNEYGKNYSPGLDRYKFENNSFNFVERIKPPTYGSGQGVDFSNGKYFWADRPGNQIIVANNLKQQL